MFSFLSFKKSTLHQFSFFAFACFSALAASFFFEYILKLPVCQLCLYERYPYIAAFGFSLFGVVFYKNQSAVKFSHHFIILTFCISLLLSLYHVLIEYNLLALPDFCKIGLLEAKSFEALKNQIMSAKNIIPCNQVSFKILFLSLAEWNVLFSAFLLTCSYKIKK